LVEYGCRIIGIFTVLLTKGGDAGDLTGQTLFDRVVEAIKPLAPIGRNAPSWSTTTGPNRCRWTLSHMHPKNSCLSNALCVLEDVGANGDSEDVVMKPQFRRSESFGNVESRRGLRIDLHSGISFAGLWRPGR